MISVIRVSSDDQRIAIEKQNNNSLYEIAARGGGRLIVSEEVLKELPALIEEIIQLVNKQDY